MGCVICGKKIAARGLCKTHYYSRKCQENLENFPTRKAAGKARIPIATRFAKFVQKMPSGCWHWTGATHWNGYGVISDWPKNRRAHRVSYEIHKGQIEDGLLVLHTCDNKICVNPDHLYLGTKIDNALDTVERGQFKPNRKLTDDEIFAIREARGTNREIASKFGVVQSTVSRIKTGARWGGLIGVATQGDH